MLAIKLTTPMRSQNFPKFKRIKNKNKIVESYLKSCFNDSYSFDHDLYTEFSSALPYFSNYISFLIETLNDVKTKSELTSAFSIQFKFVMQYEKDRNKLLFHRFFIGTINFLQASIMNNVSRYKDEKAQQDFIQYCITEMKEHLLFLLDDVSTHYNKPARA
ncbi:hypothetical protein ACLKMH_06685 [Psychromonas sp. KJ10-10]|uniref:hypothetical protein n=1 Tax=Psychromonas sp. KJ10-10 TaxID=3391823 RepID=UPI0039B6C090